MIVIILMTPYPHHQSNILTKYLYPFQFSSLEMERGTKPSASEKCPNIASDSSSEDSRNEDSSSRSTVVLACPGNSASIDEPSFEENRLLPKSVKLYQLLSTQSEDRDDLEPRPHIRRISLQISRHEEEPGLSSEDQPRDQWMPRLQEGKLFPPGNFRPRSPARKPASEPGEVESSDRLLVNPSGVRPIFPYCPYSPYASPQGSPGAKRRPLRESRRVSIDNRQGELQLNQYKLVHNIGQVGRVLLLVWMLYVEGI